MDTLDTIPVDSDDSGSIMSAENYTSEAYISSSDEHDIPENKLQLLLNRIREEIEKVDTEKEKKRNEFITDVNSLIDSIHSKKIDIDSRIDLFYTDKKAQLEKALSEAKQLNSLYETSSNEIIQRNLTKMISEFLYSTENLLRRETVFEGSNLFVEKDIGHLVRPIYEKPVRRYFAELRAKPRKIISTKDSFFILQNDFIIYDLQNKAIVVNEDRKILDMCATYEGRLSYLAINDGIFYVKLLEYDNYGQCEYFINKREIDAQSIVYGVFKDCIMLRSLRSKTAYYFEKPYLNETNFKNEIDIEKDNYYHKTFFDGIFTANETKVEYFNVDRTQRLIINIKSYPKDDLSLYGDIINKLIENQKLLSKSNELVIINQRNETANSIEQDRIFKGKNLLDYRITENEIVFCLSDRNDSKMITLEFYPNLTM
ncbi:unnamed protein product [Dimorphilus gyrociliatus]|uniref:Uncharacterized protein n=1 Tax=Dimorphilus gyrociliatus TaxID=2664684 RepID=A0A7I8VEJ3_9ANNE|nr:unnamed protein product [Dimorphilus gyrociliatus]